jgi:penicillin amidase
MRRSIVHAGAALGVAFLSMQFGAAAELLPRSLAPVPTSAATSLDGATTYRLPGLKAPAVVLRDRDGVPHIYARDEHDALFMQGYVTAEDRLFQIDYVRRTASGTLAELVGAAALPSDVELRTIGLRRAAERSFAAYSPAMKAGLEAYAKGVNAWVARNPLPQEYAALELTKFEPWTAIDSAVVGKALAFQLSFDLDDGNTRNYLQYVGRLGPQLGNALFFGDVFRAAPFDPAASVPDANGEPPRRPGRDGVPRGHGGRLSPDAERQLREYRERLHRIPFMDRVLRRTDHQIGSNEWAVSGRHTKDGRPLVANDPHLSLNLPANFHDVQLVTLTGGLNAIGSAVAGAPYVVLGQNRHVTWGETTTGFDVTDTYQEQVVPMPGSPSRLGTLYNGVPEAVIPVPLTFRVNAVGDGVPDNVAALPPGTPGVPAVALIVPRRNNGPIVSLDQATGVAFSVQYAGFGPTRELETFRLLNFARNLDEFKGALQYFDVGSQNFIYGDVHGNIAYFTTGEVPLREDLQAGVVNGAPPWFVRNGQGGNEWIRKSAPGALDGTGYEYLPFAELPQVVNPPAGFVVNANNDPAGLTLDNDPLNTARPGGGIYFLGYAFDFGTRAGRITQLVRQKLARGPVDAGDMAEIQADVTLYDASVLAPYVVRAWQGARGNNAAPALRALAADARVTEAIQRLRRWDYTAPTGIDTGYDASDVDGERRPARRPEIDDSIAATIWSVWRGQAIANGLDRKLAELGVPRPGSGEAIKALRHLVERDGIGLSTVDFFGWAGLPTAAERRDYVLLKSLKDALDKLAGPDFERAFARSTNLDDYRWGKLHRITFDGLLGGPFSIPGATPGFTPSVPGLPGLAVDGGFGVVDASSHDARAANDGAFTFGSGPNRRYVGSPGRWPGSIEARSVLPGGNSGVLGNEYYANLLGRWLTNDTYPFRTNLFEVERALDTIAVFKPAP